VALADQNAAEQAETRLRRRAGANGVRRAPATAKLIKRRREKILAQVAESAAAEVPLAPE